MYTSHLETFLMFAATPEILRISRSCLSALQVNQALYTKFKIAMLIQPMDYRVPNHAAQIFDRSFFREP